jgi:hypothetical protein
MFNLVKAIFKLVIGIEIVKYAETKERFEPGGVIPDLRNSPIVPRLWLSRREEGVVKDDCEFSI